MEFIDFVTVAFFRVLMIFETRIPPGSESLFVSETRNRQDLLQSLC